MLPNVRPSRRWRQYQSSSGRDVRPYRLCRGPARLSFRFEQTRITAAVYWVAVPTSVEPVRRIDNDYSADNGGGRNGPGCRLCERCQHSTRPLDRAPERAAHSNVAWSKPCPDRSTVADRKRAARSHRRDSSAPFSLGIPENSGHDGREYPSY